VQYASTALQSANNTILEGTLIFQNMRSSLAFDKPFFEGMRTGSSVCAIGGGVILSLEKKNSYIFVGVSAGNTHMFLRSSITGRISQLKKDATCFLPSIRFSSKNILIVPCTAGDTIVAMNHSFYESLSLASLDSNSSSESSGHDVDQYMEQVRVGEHVRESSR
jgi:hypothetical protein